MHWIAGPHHVGAVVRICCASDGQTQKAPPSCPARVLHPILCFNIKVQALNSVNFNCFLKVFFWPGEEKPACCKVRAEEAAESWLWGDGAVGWEGCPWVPTAGWGADVVSTAGIVPLCRDWLTPDVCCHSPAFCWEMVLHLEDEADLIRGCSKVACVAICFHAWVFQDWPKKRRKEGLCTAQGCDQSFYYCLVFVWESLRLAKFLFFVVIYSFHSCAKKVEIMQRHFHNEQRHYSIGSFPPAPLLFAVELRSSLNLGLAL